MKCNQPACQGIDHLGLCHQCPHNADHSLTRLQWPNHPCSRCSVRSNGSDRPNDSREQGHGRGYSYEAVPPGVVADVPAEGPVAFEDEQPPSLLDQLRAILHSFAQLTPHEYVALIEYVRPDPKTGRQRTLDGVTKSVSEILHERQISFQLCDMWIESARKKLAQGANFAAAALKMQGRG